MITFARSLFPATWHFADSNSAGYYPADRAAWVWHPDCPAGQTAVLRFRLRFEVAATVRPTVHVTADQRFQLRCDGQDVSFGPDRCDLEHWTFQSVALELSPGPHELEALAWFVAQPEHELSDDGVRPPLAQVTWRGGFLLRAEDAGGLSLDTGAAPWSVEDLTDAVALQRPRLPGYHDIGPEFTYDLARWREGTARPGTPTVIRSPLVPNDYGVRRPGWCLYPAALPEQARAPWAGGRARALRASHAAAALTAAECDDPALGEWQELVTAGKALTVPAHTALTLLWDLEDYRCGYPQMGGTGGQGATVEWSWAEAFYEETTSDEVVPTSSKGHRGEIVGKVFVGIADRWLVGAEGVDNLPALWWRCGRYVRLRVHTADEPLTLTRLGINATGFPLGAAGRWQSSDPAWDRLLPLFERAFRCAGHETWTDTPYYEQMCYVGDNVLTALTNYAWFEDARLSRRSLQLFDWSRRASGLVAERYPCGWRQESPTFSLLWPAMVRDYAMWQDDPAFVRSLLPGLRSVLAEFDALAGDDGLLHALPGWPFVDWVLEWKGGCGPGVREGDSSIVNLHWCLAHLAAMEVERVHGDERLAARSRELAADIFARLMARYWDEGRGLLLDTLGDAAASEHAQMLALLTGLLDAEKTPACLDALRNVETLGLARATIYGSFYVLDALYRHGQEDELHRRLEPWRALPDLGFTNTPEQPEPTRSDAHAWGAHPAWHSLASLAGVRPAAPGFAQVRVAPCPGALTAIACTVKHPRGWVALDLRFADGAASGSVELPSGVSGGFFWRGRRQELHAGSNVIG